MHSAVFARCKRNFDQPSVQKTVHLGAFQLHNSVDAEVEISVPELEQLYRKVLQPRKAIGRHVILRAPHVAPHLSCNRDGQNYLPAPASSPVSERDCEGMHPRANAR